MAFLWIILILVVGLLAYIRLAPHDVTRWHHSASDAQMGETQLDGGYIWRQDAGADGSAKLAKLDQVVRATPRTVPLAGSVQDGQITYITRSKVIGFPDYTTVTLKEGVLEIYGRLRFGKSDLGVNAKRIKGWRAQL
jgi:hypothetical protein